MKSKILTLCMLLLTIQMFAQEPTQPYIEVTASASTDVEPDEIDLRIVLNESEGAKKLTLPQKESLLRGALSELGIDIKNLQLEDALSRYNESWWKSDQIKTVKTFTLRVQSANMLSKVLESFRDKDISNVQIIKVEHSKKEQFMRETRIKAAKAAKEKAMYMVEAIGNQLGTPLYFIEQEDYLPQLREVQNAVFKLENYNQSAETNAKDEISFKKITYHAKVLIRYAIK